MRDQRNPASPDLSVRLLRRNDAARFDSASSTDRTWTAYNGFGEATSSGVSLGSFSASFSFQFDADGNRTRVTYGDSNYVTYGFDGLDRPSSILRSGSTTLASFTYNSRGARASIGGNFATSYGYHPDGRLSTLTNSPLASGYTAQYTFGYNPASQIIQQGRDNDAFAWTGAVNGTQSYSTNGLNQYTMAGFAHDANGNLTSDGSTTFVYDVENRLVTATGAKNATLRYDPMGRLYETTGGSAGLTRFAYDGDALVQEFNGSGTLLRRYVHGTDEGDDPLVWFENSGFTNAEQRLLRSDHQGSIVAVTDATSASVLAVNTFDEYGQQGGSNQGRFQYTGQTWMPELGLYYYKARMYSPSLGRFMQTDPIGYKDDLNLYAYVQIDPVNKTDPTGLATCADKACKTSTIDAHPAGPTGPTITFKNDNPNNPSPNQPVSTATAKMVESAVISSGVQSVNINSTTGAHSLPSRHAQGKAVDINNVNGQPVKTQGASPAVKSLQSAFANESNIRENFGPAGQTKVSTPGAKPVPVPQVAAGHQDHIHASGQN